MRQSLFIFNSDATVHSLRKLTLQTGNYSCEDTLSDCQRMPTDGGKNEVQGDNQEYPFSSGISRHSGFAFEPDHVYMPGEIG